MSCGLRGKSRENPPRADTKATAWKLRKCSEFCRNSPGCESWSFSNKGCDIYNATLEGNVETDPKSRTWFYDLECPLHTITGALRLTKEDGTLVGYVSKAFNIYGQQVVTTKPANALRVLIRIPKKGCIAKDVDIHKLNAIDYQELKLFSPVVGFSSTNISIGDDSHKYGNTLPR